MPKMNDSNIGESTKETYGHCLNQWFRFARVKKKQKLSDDQIEYMVLAFIENFRSRKKSVAYLEKHISALVNRYGTAARSASIRTTLKRYARELGKPQKKQSAISVDQLEAMVEVTTRQRDKTILTLGWAGALRASEIVFIRRRDLEHTANGFVLTVTKSKTDQFGKGRQIPIPYYHIARARICPARNLEAYLMRQADFFITVSPDYFLFPFTTRTISRIVQNAAKRAGFEGDYTSHSLRRGLATSAAEHGIDDRVIMRHGRWVTREVFDRYVEEGTLWSRTALDFLR